MKNQRYETEFDWNTILAIGLIVTGMLFISGQVFGIGIGAATIVFFILTLLGVPFLYPAITGGKDMSWLAIPGSLISGTGAILMLQSLTGHWESWAYAWTLYGVLIGWPLFYAGKRNNESVVQAVGRMLSAVSSVGFVAMFLFFELLIFNGSGGRFLLGLVIVGFGVWLIMRDNELDLNIGLGSADKPKRKNSLDAYVESPPIETAESYVQAAKLRLRESIEQADGDLQNEPAPNGSEPVQEH